jgi:ferric-dicitrate binding protein FerR (iron transport regulator)
MAGEAPKAKHHAHIAPDTSGGSKQIIIVAVIAAVLGGGGIWYLNRAGEDNKLNTMFKSEDAKKISTNNGQRGEMTLSDSSVLSIAPATKLTIIPDYNKQYRGIKVEGGLKINVKSVANTPLELRVGGAALVLTEGSVVARSYADEGDGYIKLTSGSGELRAKEVRRQLTGPVAILVGKDSSITDADAGKADEATAFADGKVVINGAPLSDVLKLFTKYYALTMEVKDEALLARPVTMTADFAGKKEAIAALEAAAMVKFGYEGTSAKPVLKDDPAAAAKAAKAAAKK